MQVAQIAFLDEIATPVDSYSANTDDVPLYAKESKLVKKLMDDYDGDIAPQSKSDAALLMTFYPSLSRILEVNEKSGVIYISLYPRLVWMDERLSWTNLSDSYPFKKLTIRSSKVWTPDVSVFNSLQPESDSHLLQPSVVVMSDGHVIYIPHMILKTPCQMSLVSFPFDTQTCHIYMGSWSMATDQLKISNANNDDSYLASYEENSDWKIENFTIVTHDKHYPGVDESYSIITLTLRISRKSAYFYRVFIAPAAVSMFLIPVLHFVPPSSNEKLTLGGLLLVATTILFQMAEQFFPAFSLTNVPLVLHYYTGLLVLLFVSINLSCLSVMIGTGDTKSKRVPRFLRICCIDKLGYIFCAKGRTARYDYELLHLEKALRYSVNRETSRDETEMEDVNDSSDGEPANNANSENVGKQDDGMAEVLKTLINELQYSRYKEQIKSEWAQLAIIIDRLGALIILTLAIIITAVISMQS